MTDQHDTYVSATEKFLNSAGGWLQDEDAPAVASLRAIARSLDVELVPSLASAYERAYRALLKRKPTAAPAVDPLEAALLNTDAKTQLMTTTPD